MEQIQEKTFIFILILAGKKPACFPPKLTDVLDWYASQSLLSLIKL